MARPCLFFSKLPTELRLDIYELACASTNSIDEPVHLPVAKPPSKAFISVSRQMHMEAKSIYRRAYRDYWTTTNFYISSKAVREKHGIHPDFIDFVPWSRDDINHISNLTIKAECANPEITYLIRLLNKECQWTLSEESKYEEGEKFCFYLLATYDPEGRVSLFQGTREEVEGFPGAPFIISLTEQLRAIIRRC